MIALTLAILAVGCVMCSIASALHRIANALETLAKLAKERCNG